MAHILMGGFTIAMGLVAVSIGVLMAQQHLDLAHQSDHRMARRRAAMPWDWQAWFFGGFSGVAFGLRGLWAIALCVAWTLAGFGVVGLGIQLFSD